MAADTKTELIYTDINICIDSLSYPYTYFELKLPFFLQLNELPIPSRVILICHFDAALLVGSLYSMPVE